MKKEIVEKITRANEETIDGFINDGNVLVTVKKVLEELKITERNASPTAFNSHFFIPWPS